MRFPVPTTTELFAAKADAVMLPSLHATSSGHSPIVLSRASVGNLHQAKKMRAVPHLPKVSGWRSRAAAASPDMNSHINLPLPGKQKASQSATAHNFAQVQPTMNNSSQDSHGISPQVSTSLSFIEEDSEDRSSLIERDNEELADTLDVLKDLDDDDELDLFDCKATRKWRAKKEREKERQRRNVGTVTSVMTQAVTSPLSSRGKKSIYHSSASTSDQLPGLVGALSRKSRVPRKSFSDTTATHTNVIVNHMGAQLARVNKVMDMLKEEEEKEEGCEIDEPLKKAIPLITSDPKPRQTVIMRKIKRDLNTAQQHLEDVAFPEKRRIRKKGEGQTLKSIH